MKRHYIILSAALATTMGLTSCGTMYLEGADQHLSTLQAQSMMLATASVTMRTTVIRE